MKLNDTCCNINCSSPRHFDGKKMRPDCSRCHDASYGRIKDGKLVTYRSGVIPVKKTYCENYDGHLGFPCYCINPHGLESYQLDIDHIDGNHLNNRTNNLKTLCKMCHARKTKEQANSGRIHAEIINTYYNNIFIAKVS